MPLSSFAEASTKGASCSPFPFHMTPGIRKAVGAHISRMQILTSNSLLVLCVPGPLYVHVQRQLNAQINQWVGHSVNRLIAVDPQGRSLDGEGPVHTVLAWDSLFALASSTLSGRAASRSATCTLLSSSSRFFGRYTAAPQQFPVIKRSTQAAMCLLYTECCYPSCQSPRQFAAHTILHTD